MLPDWLSTVQMLNHSKVFLILNIEHVLYLQLWNPTFSSDANSSARVCSTCAAAYRCPPPLIINLKTEVVTVEAVVEAVLLPLRPHLAEGDSEDLQELPGSSVLLS